MKMSMISSLFKKKEDRRTSENTTQAAPSITSLSVTLNTQVENPTLPPVISQAEIPASVEQPQPVEAGWEEVEARLPEVVQESITHTETQQHQTPAVGNEQNKSAEEIPQLIEPLVEPVANIKTQETYTPMIDNNTQDGTSQHVGSLVQAHIVDRSFQPQPVMEFLSPAIPPPRAPAPLLPYQQALLTPRQASLSALRVSIQQDSLLGVSEALNEIGVDINLYYRNAHFDDFTPLTFAIHTERVAISRLLIDLGADIDFIDGHGRSPLAWAVYQNSELCVKLLLERGADTNIFTEDRSLYDMSQASPEVAFMFKKNSAALIKNAAVRKYKKLPIHVLIDELLEAQKLNEDTERELERESGNNMDVMASLVEIQNDLEAQVAELTVKLEQEKKARLKAEAKVKGLTRSSSSSPPNNAPKHGGGTLLYSPMIDRA